MSPEPTRSLDSDEDIEIIAMEDVIERPLSPRQNSMNAKPDYMLARDVEELSDDEEDNDIEGQGDTALLRPQGHRRRHSVLEPIGRRWPQIRNIVIESAPTLLLTTVGLLFTGELLDQVSRWRAMREVHQLIMIIPVVLNLKGNLEMNLSARLGTAANVGDLDDPAVRRSIIIGNLSLLQVQATVVSLVAACVALVLGAVLPRVLPVSAQQGIPANSTEVATRLLMYARRPIPISPIVGSDSGSRIYKLILVASTSMTAACLSSVVLGSFMCFLILVCRHYGRDPDNIAPPVASCLGDLVTLCFIGLISTALIRVIETPIPFILAVFIIISAITCLAFTSRNEHVRPLLSQGWSPLFGAMVISSGTGIVLDRFVSRYEGFALLAVVISGLPGSVGSILVSRLSTSLHAAALSITPTSARFSKNIPEPSINLVMITLLFITLPVEIIFLAVIRGLGWLQLPILFVGSSIIFFFFAVSISLFVARLLTEFLWKRNLDPDMYALPIHSALMDLVGQTLLVICFEIVQLLGARVRMRS